MTLEREARELLRLVRALGPTADRRAILRAVVDGLGGAALIEPAWPRLPVDLAAPLAAAAAGLPPETAGLVYEQLLAANAAARRASGSHYTTPELAAEVVAATLEPLLAEQPGATLTICDPAVGGGIFLLAAHRYLSRVGGRGELWGVDRDPLAVAVARLTLTLATGANPGSRLAVGDALLEPPAGALGFRWSLVAPVARGGFDAVVGNPPFLGGSRLSGTFGREYRERLVHEIAGGRRGNADLCAYFLLKAVELVRPGGRVGLVCTSTISEGATRQVGLELALARGASCYRADPQRSWPGRAATTVSLVWLVRGPAKDTLDAGLRPAGRPRRARRLADNLGLAYNGQKIYGQGLLLTATEAAAWLDRHPRDAAVLRPYLSGDDLYGRWDRQASRWVIDFGERSLAEAAEHPELLERVQRLVKPDRDRLRGRNPIGDRRAAEWWRFGSSAPALQRALAGRSGVLAKVLHSHTHAFVPTAAGQVFSHGLCVFVDDDPALLAALEATPHRLWARLHGSTLGSAPRYTLSRTFETFPLPPRTAELRAAGQRLEAHRRAVAAERREGLTRLLLRVADPAVTDADIVVWRELALAVDRAVAAAYGWTDLDLAAPQLPPDLAERLLDRLWELAESN